MVSAVGTIGVPTLNPGDRVKPGQTLEEKAKQLAVHAPDITGDYLEVPTYFIVNYPDGAQKALHHIQDAEAISDIARQLKFSEDEDGAELATATHSHNLNGVMMGLMLLLCLMTIPILVGIF